MTAVLRIQLDQFVEVTLLDYKRLCFSWQCVWLGTKHAARPLQRLITCSISNCSLFFGFFLNLVRGLLVLLTDFVELLHVIEKLCAALKSDE
jgi:hypothetical protein